MDNRQIQFGVRVRQARKARQLSQAQLSETIQISMSHMSDIENGKTNINLDIFFRLTQALEVSADWLLQTNNPGTSEVLDKEFSDLLFDCTTREKSLLLKMARDMKEGLRSQQN